MKYEAFVEDYGRGSQVQLNLPGASHLLDPDTALGMAEKLISAARAARINADKEAPGWSNRLAAKKAAEEIESIAKGMIGAIKFEGNKPRA